MREENSYGWFANISMHPWTMLLFPLSLSALLYSWRLTPTYRPVHVFVFCVLYEVLFVSLVTVLFHIDRT